MHTHTLLRIVLHSLLTQTQVQLCTSVCVCFVLCAQFDSFLVLGYATRAYDAFIYFKTIFKQTIFF